MKKETNFNFDKRKGKQGKDLLKILRMQGYEDEEIKKILEDMKRYYKESKR